MLLLKNLEEFENRFKIGKKWLRCREAIESIQNIKPYQFRSIGDSLVYLLDNGAFLNDAQFVGHRRYMDIYYIIDGCCTIEYNVKTALKQTKSYIDESDDEYFEGRGEFLTLKQGALIIFEPQDAHRILSSQSCRKLILKVTVEDNTFLNK